MPAPLDSKDCVLCRQARSSRKGEHVWPLWYLRSNLGRPGPYSWSISGEPIRRRDGSPIAPTEKTRVKIPVCERCNAELERRFETPAKDILRRLFACEGFFVLDSVDVRNVALWFIKTWLLLSHPESQYSNPRIDHHRFARWSAAAPHEFYEWMVTRRPPPPGISLWLYRPANDDTSNRRSGPLVPLPVVTADGKIVEHKCLEVTLYGLCLTLVFHPGWEIDHPLEAGGHAIRLWPRATAARLDLTTLRPVSRAESVRWLRCYIALAPGILGSGSLPPLSAADAPLGIQTELLPYVLDWSA